MSGKAITIEKISYIILSVLIVFMPIQDLILAAVYDKTSSVLFVKTILLLKEVLVLFGFFCMLSLFLNGRCIEADVFILMFFLLILVYSIIGLRYFEVKSVVSEARSFLSLFLAYFMMRSITDIKLIKRLMQLIIGIGFFVTICAYIELNFLTFWSKTVPIGKYMTEVKGLENLYYAASGVPDNYYRDGQRRMVSVFGDPLFFGYFLLLYILVLTVYIRIFNGPIIKFVKYFSIITLLISYVRGPIVVYLAILGFYIYQLNNVSRLLVVLLFSCVFIFGVYELDTLYNSLFVSLSGSNLGHVEAFLYGMSGVIEDPFGVGIGGAGTLSSAFGGSVYKNTENTLLNLWLQAGVFSVVIFIMIFLSWLKYFVKGSENIIGRELKVIYSSLLVGMIVMCFISPQLWALRTGFFYFLFIGMLISLKGNSFVIYSKKL